jgi:Concanavalin A-like lectin/glucanases superfamily
MKMHLAKSIALPALAAALALTARARAAATLAADYQVQNTYASSVGTIGPLAVVGESYDVSFTNNVDVDGNTQTVLTTEINGEGTPDVGGGVQAQTAGFIASDNYSIVLLADFSLQPDLLATKVFDFQNLSSDDGLYINDATGLLYFNGVTGATGGTPAVSGTYTQIVLTRDSATGEVSVYQDGSPAFAFDDSSDEAVLADSVSPSSNAYLTVFKDDGTGVGSSLLDETTVGDIARLRLYDGVLTPDQVAALDTVVPEPLSLSSMVLGAGLLLRRRR